MQWFLVPIWMVAIVSLGHRGAAQVTQGPTIRSFHVTSDIQNHYATTLITCRYVNPSSQPGEASFIITLPDEAFISDFVMERKGKVLKGHMRKRAKYNRAVDEGQSAGSVALDARDSNQFTVSVNIEAQGKVTFNLTYEQLLTRNLGVYTNTINISPRQIVEDMSITVRIEEFSAISHLEVSELQVPGTDVPRNKTRVPLARITEVSAWEKEVTWAPTPDQQKELGSEGFRGQFVVKYDVSREDGPLQSLSDDEFFINFFAPENLHSLKKHMVFVLDYSGSMDGVKVEQLRAAMNKILSDLEPTDFFSIVIFNGDVEVWSFKDGSFSAGHVDGMAQQGSFDYLIESSPENIANASRFLNDYSANGGTNIIGGLRTGLQLVTIGNTMWANNNMESPQPIIVFLTDGDPTVEETNTDVIVREITALNTLRSSIYSLGFGYDSDMEFLRKLSLLNEGSALAIYEAADVSIQLNNFYQSIGSPLITDVNFKYLSNEVDTSTTTKSRFPMFAKGSELVVSGKLRKGKLRKQRKIGEVTGVGANEALTYPIIHSVKNTRSRRSLEGQPQARLEKMWAHLSIHQLLDEADSLDDGENKTQVIDKATELSLKYSLATPVTSVVVAVPDQDEIVVETVPVKAGTWSFVDGNGIDLIEQPSVSLNYTNNVDTDSGRPTASPGFTIGCTAFFSVVVFVVTSILTS